MSSVFSTIENYQRENFIHTWEKIEMFFVGFICTIELTIIAKRLNILKWSDQIMKHKSDLFSTTGNDTLNYWYRYLYCLAGCHMEQI